MHLIDTAICLQQTDSTISIMADNLEKTNIFFLIQRTDGVRLITELYLTKSFQKALSLHKSVNSDSSVDESIK